LITSIAQRAGFGGGLVVDYPNSNKAKKVFLVLIVGSGGHVPKGLEGEEEAVEDDSKAQFEKRRERARARKSSKKKNVKDRDWILKKKDVSVQYAPGPRKALIFLQLYRQRGKESVPRDSKYTGRKRKVVF
jgi:18S rRNA (guanine1575-N7)-methyltransferase